MSEPEIFNPGTTILMWVSALVFLAFLIGFVRLAARLPGLIWRSLVYLCRRPPTPPKDGWPDEH